MKKAIALIIACLLLLSICACSSGKQNSSETKQNTSNSAPVAPSDEDLKKAIDLLKQAENDIITTSSIQINGWSKYSDITGYYFNDDGPNQASERSIKQRAQEAADYRASARQNLEKAKTLLGSSGTGDFYLAVKEYYKSVSKFFSLISTFPEGYSLLTFSNTVASYKSECQSAYEEAAFYK